MTDRLVPSFALGRRHLLLRILAAAVALGSTGSLPAHAQPPQRNAPAADHCLRRRAIGTVAIAALGGAAALLNFETTALMLFSAPDSPSAPARATFAGALLGAGAGLLQADASASCLRADGSVPESATTPSVDRIVPGVQVRVTAPAFGPRPVTRRVVDRRGDTLSLASAREGANDTTSVILDDVSRLEVARVRGFSASPHMVGGAVLGAVAGGVLGYNQAKRSDRTCFIVCDATPMEEVYFGAFDGAIAGVAVALLMDRWRSTPEWIRVTGRGTPDGGRRFGVGIAPSRGGVTLAITLRNP